MDANIGRIIIAGDGFTERQGQIIAATKDRWGSWYMVAFEDGTVDHSIAQHSIKEEERGIGYHFAK